MSAYGADVPINQVANLSVPEPTLIVAAPWDPKMAGEIERAIRKSDLGLESPVRRQGRPDSRSRR